MKYIVTHKNHSFDSLNNVGLHSIESLNQQICVKYYMYTYIEANRVLSAVRIITTCFTFAV